MSRLSAERLDELYTGTLKIVSMRGFDNLTMDEIAAATKCSKATLYRQWGSKASLVVQALQCTAQSRLEIADTGSLRGDLRHMFAVRDRGDNDDGTQLMGAILHAMKQDPELGAAVRQEILQPIHERIGTLLQRAINRGEIAEDSPGIPHVNLALMAPFVLQVALTGVEPDDEFLYGYIDGLVLPALGIH